jgi:hypothetical protein
VRLTKGYNEQGFAAVLDGAHNLVGRAAHLFREIKTAVTPPAVSAAYRREADACLAEAAELIEAVRNRGRE